jgi:hypothetical protein
MEYIKKDPTFSKQFGNSSFKIMSKPLENMIVNMLYDGLTKQR